MRQMWLVLGPPLLGAAAIWMTWLTSERPRTRRAFLLAVLGSIVAAYEALLFSLCGLGENLRSGFQCHPTSDRLILLGIPLLLLGALGVSRTTGSISWILFGAALLFVVVLAPLVLRPALY